MTYKKIKSFIAQGQVSMTDFTGNRILLTPLELPFDTNFFDIEKIIITLSPFSEAYFLAGLAIRMDIIIDGKSLIDYALNFSKTTDATFIMTSHINKLKFKTPIFQTQTINLAYFNNTAITENGYINIYGNFYEVAL